MRTLEFKINSVELILKECKTGWALNYWNTVLNQLHARRDMSYDDRMAEYEEYEADSYLINTKD